jgi:hypothetical protein
MALVPTLATTLLPLVAQNMPHKVRDRDTQCMYLRAVVALAEAPAGLPVREALLVVVVEHLLTLDVEIRWEDIVEVPTGGRGAWRRVCLVGEGGDAGPAGAGGAWWGSPPRWLRGSAGAAAGCWRAPPAGGWLPAGCLLPQAPCGMPHARTALQPPGRPPAERAHQPSPLPPCRPGV